MPDDVIPPPSDQALLDRWLKAAAGDDGQRAASALDDRLRPIARGIALRADHGNKDFADTVAQAAMVKFFDAAKGWGPKDAIREPAALLRRITSTCCIDALRARKRAAKRGGVGGYDDFPEVEDEQSRADTPAQDAGLRDRHARLREAIALCLQRRADDSEKGAQEAVVVREAVDRALIEYGDRPMPSLMVPDDVLLGVKSNTIDKKRERGRANLEACLDQRLGPRWREEYLDR